jgi:D-serine deaminase-like pyridoxal phosphate-dependent protein
MTIERLSPGQTLGAATRVGMSVLCVGVPSEALDDALLAVAAHRPDVPVFFVDDDQADAIREHFQLGAAPVLVFLRRGVEVGRIGGPIQVGRWTLALDCALEAPPGVESMRAEALELASGI